MSRQPSSETRSAVRAGASPRAQLEVFQFGCGEPPLLGCHHRPAAETDRGQGVVLCAPMGSEYIRSHRAVRQLATRLCRLGFDVLRFDYFGCGDSGGESSEGSVSRWCADVELALATLRERSALDGVSLAGLRLGATLALTQGLRIGAQAIALWDPVVNGAAHVDELIALHNDALSAIGPRARNNRVGEQPRELLGFAVSPELLAELRALDLTALQAAAPPPPVMIVETREGHEGGRLAGLLRQAGARVHHEYLPGDPIWIQDPDRALVPNAVLNRLTSWLDEVCP